MPKYTCPILILALVFGIAITLISGLVCRSPNPTFVDEIPIPITGFPICGYPLDYCTGGFSRIVISNLFIDACIWITVIYAVMCIIMYFNKKVNYLKG